MIEEDKSEIVSFVDEAETTTSIESPSPLLPTTDNTLNNTHSNDHASENQINSASTGNRNPLLNEHIEEEEQQQQNNSTSSIENMIPPQLQKGFSIFSSWVNQTAVAVSTKASEVNNSDTMKDFKQKSQRFANDTIIAASPMWEATKENMNLAMEVTYQSTSQVVEQLKPALHEVCCCCDIICYLLLLVSSLMSFIHSLTTFYSFLILGINQSIRRCVIWLEFNFSACKTAGFSRKRVFFFF
jgi:hypothetical protein